MKRQKVAILYGGPSNEHEVSINSAKNVIANIDTGLYEPIEVYISKEGLFSLSDKKFETETALEVMKRAGIDAVLPILHGSFGEDGTLQKALEEKHLAFVGSGSVASALAMDKHRANDIFKKNNLIIPESQMVTINDEIKIKFPVIIKPVDEGSSLGVFRFESSNEYTKNAHDVFKNHSIMLAQECIVGREFTCGVVEIEGALQPLPVTEIILTKSKMFDYDAKYTSGACLEITPAEIDQKIAEQIQNIAVRCHDALGCKSISRTDMILSTAGGLYILETNTLPGMTKTSFIPAQASAAGIDMKKLITFLIKSAHL